MKRIVLACFLVVVLIALVVGCAKPAEEEVTPTAPTAPTAKPEVYRLKFADWDPATSVFARTYRDPWAKLIERETGGRVVIDIYGSETLVKAADLYDALLTGISDINLIGATRTPGRCPLVEMNAFPFFAKSSLIMGLATWEAFEEGYYADEFKDVKVLSFRPNGPANLTHRSKYIKTLEDWKGQRWAGTGLVHSELARLLGGTATALGPGETYPSLERGLIEMTILEWEGQYIWKNYEVTKYRTDKVNLMLTGAPCLYAMSLDTYNKLPADIRAVFDKYSGQWLTELTSANMDRECWWRFKMILEFDQKMGNPPVYNLPDAERKKWIEAIKPMYDDYVAKWEAKGKPARKLYEKLLELSSKYEAMYPPGSDAEYAVWKKYGYEAVYPGYPEGFEMPAR